MRCRVLLEASRGEVRAVDVPRGATLLDAVLRGGLPLARACDGHGLCGRCGVEVRDGAGRLSAQQLDEREALRRNRGDPGQRLACCARVEGDVRVRAHYW